MALDLTIFQTIVPSRFLSFTIPHPTLPTHLLRVAILDSPTPSTESPQSAALFVPLNRESDWIFSTESGHLQLLLSSPGISRLILICKNPINDTFDSLYKKDDDTQFVKSLVNRLNPLFIALSPKNYGKDEIFDVPILEYVDNLISSVVLERCRGVFVGEMVIEDVEIENDSESREFRRRLRFKRMPNLIQTEIRVVPETSNGLDCVMIGGELEFRPDLGVLVHPYFTPMMASLSLASCHIEDRIRKGLKPRALCLGVGGGAILSFLRTQLGFDVFGVEMDEEVLRVARQYFGLENSGIQVFVGDALEFLETIAGQRGSSNLVSSKAEGNYVNHAFGTDCKFDVVMVDLDSCDPRTGVSAPPLELIQRHIVSALRTLLCDFGIMVMNVIPPSRPFYDTVLSIFRESFHDLYEIDVGNGENFVLIANMSPVISSVSNSQNTFLKKLKEVILGKYLDSIKKI
ncbi:uncharacterized protein LOC126659540 [Mercurialis annua]|uniref:uncharacterized protein LOC126659540 n=1 Tax=Mercurialis annua TaxID=3986 RepID=UPI00215E9F89|nr:uncharacterized protein LOC126659540 [Mercurialis annua]XP_055960051.1 uncharacterized protein LOC126659540 [Mercurialis annua]XP_055960052.1 uncharacterized protein LOC126659540 [Mercurialis annua]